MVDLTAATTDQLEQVHARYPRQATLRDGQSVELRLMAESDREAVLAFARGLPNDDLLFLQANITEPAAIDSWLEAIRTRTTTTVLAFNNGEVIGDGSMHHHRAQWTRHIGEIRLLIGAGGRGQGLGRILADEIYSIANTFGLRMLTAQMTFDQQAAISIFRRLGFQREAVLTDYVMDAAGNSRDLLVATRRL
ncbi:MAG: L-amino acid N-acyltransferase YncA [Chloroflexi bacterium]|nr:MAG: L-amino acid N-acyltransferase YncA [Chloroflexota bacterium]